MVGSAYIPRAKCHLGIPPGSGAAPKVRQKDESLSRPFFPKTFWGGGFVRRCRSPPSVTEKPGNQLVSLCFPNPGGKRGSAPCLGGGVPPGGRPKGGPPGPPRQVRPVGVCLKPQSYPGPCAHGRYAGDPLLMGGAWPLGFGEGGGLWLKKTRSQTIPLMVIWTSIMAS